MRDWRVDFEGFLCDAFALIRAHRLHGREVVQSICQFDEDNAHIVGHGEQHFTKAFGLLRLFAVKMQLVQFGQTIDQIGHRRAELIGQRDFVNAAIFQNVV